MKHYPPSHWAQDFHCPSCGVYASQIWGYGSFSLNASRERVDELSIAKCSHCRNFSYWVRGSMVYPSTGSVELPNPDMPEDCLQAFKEARDIVGRSPRGAAALLRLCIQMLMVNLGLPGRNINDDIVELVKNGLPTMVQQSLDVCRVVGNNAVHPGEINFDDTPEMAGHLFRLINIIVYNQITTPKEVEAVYSSLPSRAIEAIERRDKDS